MNGRAFAIKPCRVTDDVRVFLSDLPSPRGRGLPTPLLAQFPTCRITLTDVRERVSRGPRSPTPPSLEDDYCRDFRYQGSARWRQFSSPWTTGARHLHGHVPENCSLPALSMNHLKVPTPLLKRGARPFASSYSPVPWLNQQVLARFMTDGSWGRHLRRVQTRNRRKYERAHGGGANIWAARWTSGVARGLHLLVRVREEAQPGRARGRRCRRRCGGTTTTSTGQPRPSSEGVVLVGFSSIAEADIRPNAALQRERGSGRQR